MTSDAARPALTREQAQVQLILDEYGTEVEVYPQNWRDAASGAQYLHHARRVLVRDRDLPRVRDLFNDTRAPAPSEGMNGLTRYELPEDFAFPDDEPHLSR